MVMLLDLIIMYILFVFIYRSSITRRSYIGLLLVCSFAVFLSFNDHYFAKLYGYFLLLMFLAYFVDEKYSKTYATASIYFMSTMIVYIIFGGLYGLNGYEIVGLGLLDGILYFLAKLFVFSFLYIAFRKTIYKRHKLLEYFNQSNGYILIVLFFTVYLQDVEMMDRYSVDSTLFFKVIFSIIYFIYLTNFFNIYLYYKRIIANELMVHELNQKYEEISNISLGEKNKIIVELRELVKEEKYDEIIEYTNQFHEDKIDDSLAFRLNGINDDYLKLVISKKIKEYQDVITLIDIDEFDVYSISSTEDYFLEMFTIILDNSFAAARKSALKTVGLVFKGNKITVYNSFNIEDLKNYKSKTSNKGLANRINGLYLLDRLIEKSGMTVRSSVSDFVKYEMVVATYE